MIDFINQVPSVYSAGSRDFQMISRLYTLLFNASRSFIDQNNPYGSHKLKNLSDLSARTVNFITKHTWDDDTLLNVSSCFNYLIKNKGTTNAIEYCINILLRSLGISSKNFLITTKEIVEAYPDTWARETENKHGYLSSNSYYIAVPRNLATLGVIQDLMDYILPVGVTCRVIEFQESDFNADTTLKVITDKDNNVTKKSISNKDLKIKSEVPIEDLTTTPRGTLLFNKVIDSDSDSENLGRIK